MSGFSEYGQYDGLGLAELVRRKEISPRELLEEAIARTEAVNPRLNAVIHTMYDHARELTDGDLPDGPFSGVPFLLKDMLAFYAGHPLRFGSRAMRDHVADRTSTTVTRFLATGLVPFGKTNAPEMGLEPFTEPELFGPTHNPWDPARSPSGSSGGAAAAVAARIVPVASGGDGGGSIRTPSSACGVFGMKPSRGRNPVGPDVGEIWQGAVAEHVLTRTVRDSAAMLDVTAGPDAGALYHAPAPEQPFLEAVTTAPGRLRIAFTTESLLGSHVDGACVQGVERTVTLLRELGHEVVNARPHFDRRAFLRAFIIMVSAETAADLDECSALVGRRRWSNRRLELETRAMQLLGRQIATQDFIKACRHLQRVARLMGQFLDEGRYDAFLTPTLGAPPVPIGTLRPSAMEAAGLRVLSALKAGNLMRAIGFIDTVADKVFGFSAYCALFNVSGQPAMSMPLHWSDDGLPVGMHFVAPYAHETTLFRLAGQLERARPWRDRKPPICAD